MAEADVVRRLMAGAGVSAVTACLPPADPDAAMLRTLALGLVESYRGFDKTIDGVRYAGKVFDGGRCFGLCAIATTDKQHAVALTREQLTELGAEAAVSGAVDDLRVWVAANG